MDALWQTTLFIMLFLVAAAGFNVVYARLLPVTEGVFMSFMLWVLESS